MTGEPQRDDEPDFLDDFIIEDDAAAKDDDLDTLFESPAPGPVPPRAAGKPAKPGEPAAAGAPQEDAEDLLFTDHTEGLHPSETFAKGPDFAEQAPSSWQGDGLDLGTAGGGAAGIPVDDDAGTPADRGEAAPPEAAAEDAFEAELESLLQAEDEFALDSEKELELIEPADPQAAAAAAGEATAADTFVLDDGEGLWQDGSSGPAPMPAAADGTEDEGLEPLDPQQAVEMIEALEAGEPRDRVADEAEPTEPGWEPLPGASMDELAEVGEVTSAEDEAAAEPVEDEPQAAEAVLPRPALVGGGAPAADAAELEELYAEAGAGEPAPQLVGGSQRGRRGLRLVGTLAASLAVVAALAMVLLQPEWFGLRFDPEQVQTVQVQRPKVEVSVPTPPAPAVPVAPTPDQPTVPDAPVTPTNPGNGQVVATEPVVAPPPVAQTEPIKVVDPQPPTTTDPVPVPPVAADPTPAVVPVPIPVPNDTEPAWPVAQATPDPKDDRARAPGLVRIGEDLLVGNQEKAEVRVVDGMIPGSRAFAQLHNGNYFIGSVKHADKDRITLRVGQGEITLALATVAKLTPLGSADYEELQKVTSGFVRLRNNNRLVGSILSGIADDHVVLEFRSNRVMLPKSAVGEVVEGEDDAAVRLGTTREEEDWVQKLAERQLGTGAPPVETRNPATPPASPRGNR